MNNKKNGEGELFIVCCSDKLFRHCERSEAIHSTLFNRIG
jgi:hypothetical protein